MKLGWRYLIEFIRDGRTPIRALSDEAIRQHLPLLFGDGQIVELGAASDHYRRFAPDEQDYLTTNYNEGAANHVDMTRMPFGDESVAAFVSIFSLEHVYEYQRAIAEIERSLRPGGRLLLVMPFLYYYHAAPDDFVRLTKSALLRLLRNFTVLAIENVGSRALFVAEMYHEKAAMGHQSSRFRRLWLRLLGAGFIASHVWRAADTDAYASAYLIVCEKT